MHKHPFPLLKSQIYNSQTTTHPQALVGLERGSDCFNDPVFPDDEGLALLPYDGCLTYEGELNKMAGNIALGRSVHT